MNKRLVVLFAAIAAVIVIVVVCCVLFIVDDVSVDAASGLELTDAQEADIIARSGITGGEGIFSIDEQSAANAIEKGYPSLKVVAIERVFPNDVVIRVASRVGVVAVPIDGSDAYALVDRDLKIIGLVFDDSLGSLAVTEGYVLTGSDSDLLGSFIASDNAKWLGALIGGAEKCYLTETRFGELFSRIVYSPSAGTVTAITRGGCKLVIPLDSDIETMFVMAYAVFDDMAHGDASVGGTISFDPDRGWLYTAD